MSKKEKPKITSSKVKPYTMVSWIPDYKRFEMPGVTPMLPLLHKRVIDMAAVLGKTVKVYWNDELVKINDLAKYARLYLGDDAPIVHEVLHDRCEIVVSDNPFKKFMQVSFVNGNLTSNGGTHVNLLLKPIVDHLAEMVNKKRKTKDVNETLVENSLALFIRCDIVNPAFSGQMKETLKTRPKDFGWGAQPPSAPLEEKLLKKIGTKLSVVTNILEGMEAKDSKDAKKTDGKMTSVIRGLPKLDDALLAGTKDSAKCTRILTEGDSAKAMVLSGLSKDQRKTFGVYPLKGKIMNVKDVTSDKIHNNEEITALKKILGLETGKTYSSLAGLRYGSVMFMTDQDLDGSHIRGLGINLFHSLWKGLLQIPGFLTYMATPIVKATKGKTVKTFYTLQDYEEFKKTAGNSWSIKYYKGLGTSNRTEAQEYFKDMNVAKFTWDNGSDMAVDLAFNKKKANDRKDWLLAYDPSKILDGTKEVPYADFIHKDLIHFSYYDLIRSIPNVMDGLKVSQRKILYAGFKRNLVKEIRVAQFAGYVSEHTGYHHGEVSLNAAIVGLAQDFVGSNNLNLFMPNGQFGTRLAGGDDHASPRYIHTELNPLCESMFPKSDFDVLDYEDDDGTSVEPKWYAPVIPMILVNGANGIGTGFSTTIPCYNPKEVLEYVRDRLMGIEDEKWDPLPWYKGFRGEVKKSGSAGYEFEGIWSMKDDGKKLIVSELPIGVWTSKYKEHLEKLVDLKVVKSYQDTSTDVSVNFEIKIDDLKNAKGCKLDDDSDDVSVASGSVDPRKVFKLVVKKKFANMHVFGPDGKIVKC
jgi:DNA topoisomerase-2